MRILRLFQLVLLFAIGATNIAVAQTNRITPVPAVEVWNYEETLDLKKGLKVYVDETIDNRDYQRLMVALGSVNCRFESVERLPKRGYLNLDLVDDITTDEGYVLRIEKSGITIEAGKPAGLYYGLQRSPASGGASHQIRYPFLP